MSTDHEYPGLREALEATPRTLRNSDLSTQWFQALAEVLERAEIVARAAPEYQAILNQIRTLLDESAAGIAKMRSDALVTVNKVLGALGTTTEAELRTAKQEIDRFLRAESEKMLADLARKVEAQLMGSAIALNTQLRAELEKQIRAGMTAISGQVLEAYRRDVVALTSTTLKDAGEALTGFTEKLQAGVDQATGIATTMEARLTRAERMLTEREDRIRTFLVSIFVALVVGIGIGKAFL